MTPNNSPEINQPETIVEEQDTVVTVPVTIKEKRKPRLMIRRRAGMFDVPEIATVSVAAGLILLVLLGYLFWLRPAKAELRAQEQKRDQLETDLKKLETTLGENQTTESRVAEIVGSLDRFEVNYLPAPGAGNSSLFQRLNQLIYSNGLRNTSGPDYSPLETVALDKYDPTKPESRNQHVYPGMGVTVTVEGGYANSRRFVSDLENSPQFIVVRAIEIEAENNDSSTGGGAQTSADLNTVRSAPQASGIPPQISGIPAPQGAKPNAVSQRAPQQTQPLQQQQPAAAPRVASGSGRGSTVSMRVDLVSYFRRSGEAQPAARAQNQ